MSVEDHIHSPLHTVCAPTGGFGNHLRLLLLLSDDYVLYYGNETVETSPQKLDFVIQRIYTPERTWHNWLNYEFRFRNFFDRYIRFTHDVTVMHDSRTVAITIDPELSYRCYIKFNSQLNGNNHQGYLNKVARDNSMIEFFDRNNDHTLVLDAGRLFQPQLDTELYHDATTFLDLIPNYEAACQVHRIWYDLHKKAEREIVADLQKLYQI